ncbi:MULTISPECIES: ABC transporter ATP-binding protein [unclassified Mesorhizobium]|uniref:ABC transporter ATP-binding protein n=1 Tax=unclassified Mesorhizobium TaxID=325217 RepID=UPI00086D5C8A|nr:MULTISPECIES: ABC transporter ATP-binding protein [unclassified Mesorhizobium]MBN9255020.1 ABC transporter ATP-binding protein [Mesorhizobium sp.]ODT13373.1 MAG: hypothetical protein ABS57_18805 [Mesorhizobium sp. SCN 65-12]OJX76076.1 MAG: hypothetical protein BGO93_29170 [Mesorhizobium sp. 65-26]
MKVVDVRHLRVELIDTGTAIVDDVSFAVNEGEILGIVGESGSGKTTAALCLMGYTRAGARIAGGEILVDGRDVTTLEGAALQAFRGKVVAYVPQDPSAALNPRMRIGEQVAEALRAHEPKLSRGEISRRITEAFADVSLPADRGFLRRFPFELSGGQKQRVCIATVFLLRPRVVVLDEPTTGLDVVTQSTVLETTARLCRTHRVAALYVSHDLAVVSNLADKTMVMKNGRIVEEGAPRQLFHAPRHDYTRALVAATPHIDGPLARVAGDIQANEPKPVLSIRDVAASHGDFQVLHSISFDVMPGECLALVGESGSGKTTLSRLLIGLHRSATGTISFQGENLAFDARQRSEAQKRRMQYIFQSPYGALNNRHTIADIIATPLRLFENGPSAELHAKVKRAMDAVSLPAKAADRYPSDLSGGERQRVAIARALVLKPDMLICDEITSALDVSVQASIVSLLQEVQRTENLAMVFVTHNLALVRSIAHRTAVLQYGRLVELGETGQVIDRPGNDYTRKLVEHSPRFVEAA